MHLGDASADSTPGLPAGLAPELPDALADHAAEELLAAAAEQRSAVLAALLAAHPQHAAGLQALSAALAGTDRLLAGTYPDDAPHPETQLGGHRVLRSLGEGAFGIVFLCAQERPVVRQVAVKVLRPGGGDHHTLRRFDAERQLLATLNHPTITQVFDAGVLPDGRPFFVMEFVDGTPIRRYCDERALPCRDRLRLFVALCRGVAHAHKRGIVHRDLKPANVLVVDTDSGPLPKIIDFGIAKALVSSAGDDTPRTDAGRVLGTPGYMSPEQADGRIDLVDERTDVFALGVMLYELLTAELPWRRGAAATDTDPVRPSARVTTATGSAGTSTRALQRQHAAELRGDLDWITLKALARPREARYASATALADDVERHLEGQPVSVGPPSIAYRLGKFVQRNRPLAFVGAGALALLLAGSIGALVYGAAADAAVQTAQQSAAASFADATAAVERLLARATDPGLREAPRSDAVRHSLLRDAMALYDRFLRERPDNPELRRGRCRALLAVSQVHWLLGESTPAAGAAEAAAVEAETLITIEPDNITHRGLLGESVLLHGCALALAGNTAAANSRFVAAIAQLAPCAAAEPVRYWRLHATARRGAAQTLDSRRVDESIIALQETLATLRGLRQTQPPLEGLAEEIVETAIRLADALGASRQWAAAAARLVQAESELPRVRIGKHGLTCAVYRRLGDLTWNIQPDPRLPERSFAAAIAYAETAVAAAAAWVEEQPDRLFCQTSLADAWLSLGHKQNYTDNFAAASVSFRRQIELCESIVRRFPGDKSHNVRLVCALHAFALTLSDRFRQSDLEEASTCVARALAVDEQIPAVVDDERIPRWRLLGMQAVVESARWQGDVDRIWAEVERALPALPPEVASSALDDLIGALLGLARWHDERARTEAGATWRLRARALVAANAPHFSKRAVELGWLEAKAAAAGGDYAGAAAAADQILAARTSWLASRRAADGLHLAWRCAGRVADASNSLEHRSVADGYRSRAAALYAGVVDELQEDVAKAPDDPWFVLSWGFASVRAAELAAAAGDRVRARDLLAAALPRLDAVRAGAHADQWDADAMRDARELDAALAAAPRR